MKHRKLKKALFLALGLLCLVLAYVGIITPGLPGIPFVLLSSYLFVRSSKRMNDWMLRQRIFKSLLNKKNGKAGTGLKILVISQLWVSFAVARYIIGILNPFLLGGLIFLAILISMATWKML